MHKRIHNSAVTTWNPRLLLVCVGVAVSFTGISSAQTLDQRAQKDITAKKHQILSGRGSLSDPAFELYYKRILFAPFGSRARSGELKKAREQLARDFRIASNNQAVYDALVDLVDGLAKQIIANPRLSSAAHCNAMLILGDLNSKQPRRGPPVPYAPAMSTLLGGLTSNKSIDPVRVAALVGIQRHVDLRATFPSAGKLSAQEQTQITEAMLSIVTADQPPQGRSIAGHNWMRRNAVEVLCKLGSPGPNGNILRAAHTLIRDTNISLSVRCSAAQAIGEIKFGNAKPSPIEVAKDILALAVECCDRQQDSLAMLEKSGRFFNRKNDDEIADPRTLSVRRKLLTQLTAIRTGLIGADGDAGLKGQAGGDEAGVDGIAVDVQRVMDVLTQLDSNLMQLGDDLASASEMLRQRLGASRPAATASAPGDPPPLPLPSLP